MPILSIRRVKSQRLYVAGLIFCFPSSTQHIQIVSFQDCIKIIRNGAKQLQSCIACSDILTEHPCLKHMAIPSERTKAVVL